MDYSLITERLYTGASMRCSKDVDALVAAGVTHVIDARSGFSDAALLMARQPQISYLWDPTADDGVHPKPVEWFKKALDFALPAIAQPGKIILSHCAAGHNRGPSITFVIMRALGWSYHEALDLLHTNRPQCIGGVTYRDDGELALRQLGWIR